MNFYTPTLGLLVAEHDSQVITVAVENNGCVYDLPRGAILSNSRSRRVHEVFSQPQLMIYDAQGRYIGAHPHLLPEVRELDFDALLGVLYYGPTTTLSLQQWTGVKRLASLWDMPDILALAISNIDALLEACGREKNRQLRQEKARRFEEQKIWQHIVQDIEAERRKLQEAEANAQRHRQWLVDFPTLAEANGQ